MPSSSTLESSLAFPDGFLVDAGRYNRASAITAEPEPGKYDPPERKAHFGYFSVPEAFQVKVIFDFL
jgi:hypothetical protein